MPAPAEVQPRRHGAALVNLNQPASRTNKVSQDKVAVAKSAEKKLQASQKQPAFWHEKQNFLTRREELIKPVKAFGDCIGYLPSIPTTVAVKSHFIGYNNALIELAAQSRAFAQKFATEYGKLRKQIQLLGHTNELGHSYIDSLLDAVVKEEEVPRSAPTPL